MTKPIEERPVGFVAPSLGATEPGPDDEQAKERAERARKVETIDEAGIGEPLIAELARVRGERDAWRAAAEANERTAIEANERADRLGVKSDREWWATYRAALTGRCAQGGDDPRSGRSDEEVHRSATVIANLAHGEIYHGKRGA